MNWPDLSMGGYGFYVWGSYLFSLIAIVWEVVSLKQRKKALVQHRTEPSAVAPGKTQLSSAVE
jgi:heme exporter protein CcmD